MKPDATLHNPDPAYLRGLLQQAGLTQTEAADRIGIARRTMRHYLADRGAVNHGSAPYPVQYALEQLATQSRPG